MEGKGSVNNRVQQETETAKGKGNVKNRVRQETGMGEGGSVGKVITCDISGESISQCRVGYDKRMKRRKGKAA